MAHRFRITSVDYAPADLYAQVPFTATLLNIIPGPDRPDYWLAALDKPLAWDDSGKAWSITHIVLSARYVGQTVRPGFRTLVVGIAYVLDVSVLSDNRLEFAKCRYIAIGVAEGLKVCVTTNNRWWGP